MNPWAQCCLVSDFVCQAQLRLCDIVSAGAAMAHGSNGGKMDSIISDSHGYSGSWPVTVTYSQHSNGTYCLMLTENGSNGCSASLVIGSQNFPLGTFQVFNHTLVATIQAQGYGQNAGLVFIGSATRGNLGPGVFDDVYGGEAFDEGALAFGMKGGC
jgi:hypothetical protein